MTTSTPTGALDATGCVWGKSPEAERPYPLVAHLLDSWVTAGAVWDHWLRPGLREHLAGLVAEGDQTLARALVQRAAGLHDAGKTNPIFQTQAADSRDLAWRAGHIDMLAGLGLPVPTPEQQFTVSAPGHPARRHEFMTGVVLGGQSPDRLTDLSEHWLIQAITGHHGRWHRGTLAETDFAGRVMAGEWGDLASRIAADVTGWVDAPRPSRLAPGDAVQAIILTTGLVVLADWIASLDDNVSRGQELLDQGITPGPEWVSARMEELTDSVRASLGWYTSPPDPRAVVMRDKPSLRPLQQEAEKVASEPGLWMVAYPTGEGKTEAALLRHMGVADEGLIFALPTRSTTNAMQARLEGIFAETGNNVVLSHQFASRYVCATAGAEHGAEWYDSPVRRLVAPVVAATCDQVLSGALRGKHAALRLTALANHHVILDEIHTYDHYQTSLLAELLHWWGATNTRVTLLSATLPAWQQRELETAYRQGQEGDGATLVYPGDRLIWSDAPTVDRVGTLSTEQPDLGTELVWTSDPVAAHRDWVTAHRSRYPNAHLGVVVNTVDRAIAVARAVAAMDTGADVICLHSRFTLADRQRIESDLLARLGPDAPFGQAPVVLVGTQVIEASLDIDVDLMSTDICPAPSLIQRAGRCRRFRDPRARMSRFGGAPGTRVLQVVVPETSKPWPYLAGETDRVTTFLADQPVISIPSDVQRFVDTTTFDMKDWVDHMDSSTGREEIGHTTARLSAAEKSKAPISKGVLGRRDRYGTLFDLTNRDQGELVEDVFGTRFVDRPTGMYLLVSTEQVSLMQHDRTACLDAVDASIPVPPGIDELLRPAHAMTLARADVPAWRPRHRSITRMLPVDSAGMTSAGLVYDTRFGLRKED